MDLKGDLKEGESIRKYVPWFSIDEFKEVYDKIFSDDLKTVKRGYERLLMWKARRPVLPPGIEAMFNLCEVILQDGKYEESSAEIYDVSQLRLMYATTIMRFLNLILGMPPGTKVEKKTLFRQADEVGIPKWIVDIRHDSAHGSVMPDIGVLRSAARFCTNWLKERYWEPALHISDLVVEEGEHVVTDYDQIVDKVLECWESFAIYEVAGFTSKKQTKHSELWELVNEIAASLKSKKHRPTQEVIHVAQAVTVLNQKIRELLRNRATVAVKNIFIGKMLSGDIFLPSEKVLSLFKTKTDELPQKSIEMWNTVIKDLWESGSIPELITQLMNLNRDNNENPSRRRYALLWAHQLLKSLIMVQESKKMLDGISARSTSFQLSHVYFERYPNCSYQEQLNYAITDAVMTLRPELKGAYSWSRLQLPHFVQSKELLQICLANPPSPDVDLILTSVMELMDPPLPADMQECLKACVRIYTGQENSSKVPIHDKLYSLADVVGLNPDSAVLSAKMECIEVNGNHPETDFRPLENVNSGETGSSVRTLWERSSEVLSWSRCSLGILPWQCDNGQKVWNNLEMQNVWRRKINQL